MEAGTDEEKAILYDVLPLHEWVQDPELASKMATTFGYPDGRSGFLNSIVSLAGGALVPDAVARLINGKSPWHFCVSPSIGGPLAVLQNNHLEILVGTGKEPYSSAGRKRPLSVDVYPQWRKMCWNEDASLLAIAYSSGVIEVCETSGATFFTIEPSATPTVLAGKAEDSLMAAGIFFSSIHTRGTEWSAELVVVDYRARIQGYFVSPTEGFERGTDADLSGLFPRGITCAEYSHFHGLLILAGAKASAPKTPTSPVPQNEETEPDNNLLALRLVSEHPYYKIVSDSSVSSGASDQWSASSRTLLQRLSSFMYSAGPADPLVQLSAAPKNGRSLAGIHTSGRISVWSLPGLKLKKTWALEEQPGFDFEERKGLALTEDSVSGGSGVSRRVDAPYRFHPCDIQWWNDSCLIVARYSGSVTINSVEDGKFRNMLGENPELFFGAARFSCSPDPNASPDDDNVCPGFIAMECETKWLSRRARARSSSGHSASELEEDNDVDLDDEEDLKSSWVQWAKKGLYFVLYWVTDNDSLLPPRKKPLFCVKTFRLVGVQSTSPEELYERKMETGEYGDALSLAKIYNLDTDAVYQKQWRSAPVTSVAIQDFLRKIKKRAWVLRECLERVPKDIDAVYELLNYGLKQTDVQVLLRIGKGEDDQLVHQGDDLSDDEDEYYDEDVQARKARLEKKKAKLLDGVDWSNLTLAQLQLIEQRKTLLQYFDRLALYEKMLELMPIKQRDFDAKFYGKFRKAGVLEAALKFAHSCNFNGIDVMWTYCGKETLPHRLMILSNIPETVYPYYYRELLPECTPDGSEMLEWPEDELRKPDWCEVRPLKSSEEEALPESAVLTPEDLTNWAKARGVEIDTRSRLVENAVNFLKLCNENCIPDIEDLLEDFMVFDMIVYEAAPVTFMEKDLTFQGFAKLTDIQKIDLMMSESKEDSFVSNMTNWLKYFFAPNGRDKRDFDAKFDIIREYALKLCTEDVSKARKVLDACRKDRTQTIPDSDKFASLVIECMYACQRWEDLPAIFGMGECLHALATGTGSQSSGFAPLGAGVKKEAARAEDDLRVAEVATELGSPMVPKSVADLREDSDGVAFLFTRLCRLAVSRRPPLTKSDWFNLLKQLQEMHDVAFTKVISASRVTEIWIKALLISGSEELIKIAGSRLRPRSDAILPTTSLILTSEEGRLSYEDSVQLCLEAGREYLDACPSATGKNMSLAAACFKLVAPGGSLEIAKEMKLLEALPLLASYGVPLLPVQVRLKKDRVELVKEVLKYDAAAYAKPQSILDLALLLSPPENPAEEKKIRGRVFNILAEKAFQLKDFSVCTDLCEKILGEGHAVGWEICGKFATALADAKVGAARIPGLRSRLLSFAMAHCTAEKIHEYLETSLKIEVETEGGWKPTGSGDATTVPSSEPLSEGDTAWKKPLDMAAEGVKKFYDKMKVANEEKFADIDWFGVVRAPYGTDLKEKDEEEAGLDLAHAALRTALIDDWLGSGVCDRGYVRHVLRKIGQSLITRDEVELGLYYFLSAKKTFGSEEEDEGIDDDSDNIEDYFPVNQPVGDVMEAAQYFYARLATEKLGKFESVVDGKHYCRATVVGHRQKVIETAMAQLRQAANKNDLSPVAKKLLDKVAALRQEVDDREQAKILASVSDDIDASRFATDLVYKTDTILGLAMTSDEAVLKVAESFADKYDIPRGDIAVAHVQYLFAHHVHTTTTTTADGGSSGDDGGDGMAIRRRLEALGYMNALREHPESSFERLQASVYEGIHGKDLKSLSAYHSLVAAMFASGDRRAQTHAVFAKCLKELASLNCDLDFKAVQHAETSKDLKLHLRPAIDSKTEKIIQKLAANLEAASEDHEDPEHLVRGVVLGKAFLKRESSKFQSTEEWTRQFKARLDQILTSGAKGPVLRHFFQEVAFSRAGVKLIPREARKTILDKAAHHLVTKGFFNAEEPLLADLKSYATFLDSLEAGLSALDVELPASWIEDFETTCWQDDSMQEFFHNLIAKKKAELDIVRAFVSCLEPDRVGGGLSELQMASFGRSVEEFLSTGAENDRETSNSLAEAKSTLTACIANIGESWRAGEFFPSAEELLECVEMALSITNHGLEKYHGNTTSNKFIKAELLGVFEKELLRQTDLEDSGKTKLYSLWEQILMQNTDGRQEAGFSFEEALKNAENFSQLASTVDLMLKSLKLVGKDGLDERAWQLAVERIVDSSASPAMLDDEQGHDEVLLLLRRLIDDGLDAWNCWPPEQVMAKFLQEVYDKTGSSEDSADESQELKLRLCILYCLHSPYLDVRESCITKLKSATSAEELPAKPTLVHIFNRLIKLNQIVSIYGTAAFIEFLTLADTEPSLTGLEEAFNQLKSAGLAPQAAFLVGRRHTGVPIQLRTFRASLEPKVDWNITWDW